MQTGAHERNLRQQFGLRASSFDRSARWITDAKLTDALLEASGRPGKGISVCCGTGVMEKALVDRGWKMTGIDLTPEMVEAASRFFPAVLGSAEELPFDGASFDLALMRQAYFLLHNGPRALQEIKRVLKPGGRFVLAQTVPFSDADAGWLKRVHETKQRQMTRFFTAEELVGELESQGFKVRTKKTLSVRESISLWMANAPEMEPERREKVLSMIEGAPESYRKARNVALENGELVEDWNWVILSAEAGAK
jgi:ubiquinone/menaquinone biosynthesis C-methylase UbiE